MLNYLLDIISNPQKETSILVGRAVWTLSKLISIIRNDIDFLTKIFNAVSGPMCNELSDLSIQLVCAQCISIICQRLISLKKQIESDFL